MQDQAIVIYPNRTQTIVRTIALVVILILGLIVLAGAENFFFILGSTHHTNYIVLMIIYLILMLLVLAFGVLGTWSMARLAFRQIPLLIINHEGITVSEMPWLSGCFIPWHEIEAIHTSICVYKYLCVRPKDTRQFLQRFNVLERFYRRSNAIVGIPALFVTQVLMERPVDETLQQLAVLYVHELFTYHIQLY